jgi:hypothetical protein
MVSATTLAGLLLASLALVMVRPPASATATLLLAHGSDVDPTTAMATDRSLLTTRKVAGAVVQDLNLPLSTDSFLGTYSSTELSPQVLQLTLDAPTAGEAVRRLNSLSALYLEFRNGQLKKQAESSLQGEQDRLDSLRAQLRTANQQYRAAVRDNDSQRASDLVDRRTTLTSEISSLQQTMLDANLQADAISYASYIVDRAAPVETGSLRRLALGLMSGLIGGFAIGAGLVSAQALLSNRLRRREEVATALGVPVRCSTGALHGFLPWARPRRRRALDVLASGLLSALDGNEAGRHRIVLLGVGDQKAAARVLAHAARRVENAGRTTSIVDVTAAGVMHSVDRAGTLEVYRPAGRAEVGSGPFAVVSSTLTPIAEQNPGDERWSDSDVVMVLGDVDLGIGTQHLKAWADDVVLLVGAGKVTAEFLRTTYRLLNSSGLRLDFAMIVGADRTDESFGQPHSEATPNQQRWAR